MEFKLSGTQLTKFNQAGFNTKQDSLISLLVKIYHGLNSIVGCIPCWVASHVGLDPVLCCIRYCIGLNPVLGCILCWVEPRFGLHPVLG